MHRSDKQTFMCTKRVKKKIIFEKFCLCPRVRNKNLKTTLKEQAKQVRWCKAEQSKVVVGSQPSGKICQLETSQSFDIVFFVLKKDKGCDSEN